MATTPDAAPGFPVEWATQFRLPSLFNSTCAKTSAAATWTWDSWDFFLRVGVRLDSTRNRDLTGDRLISEEGATVDVLAVSTNEELIVARETAAVLWG